MIGIILYSGLLDISLLIPAFLFSKLIVPISRSKALEGLCVVGEEVELVSTQEHPTLLSSQLL